MGIEAKPEADTNSNDPIIEQFQTLQNRWADSMFDFLTKNKQKPN
jgi:hypothetical protein